MGVKKKSSNQDAYLLTKIYDVNRNSEDGKNSSISLIYIKPNKQLKYSEYVRLFSIRNKYDETFIKESKTAGIYKFEEEQEEPNKTIFAFRRSKRCFSEGIKSRSDFIVAIVADIKLDINKGKKIFTMSKFSKVFGGPDLATQRFHIECGA